MRVLIDGYNLIFECGLEGRVRTARSLEHARRRLVEELCQRLSAADRESVTMVFDAQRLPPGETQIQSRVQGMEVWFAVGYPDADTLIEELIAQHSSPKQLTVVSSDHRVQRAATRRRARAVDSSVWFDSLTESARAESSPPAGSKSIPDELRKVDWKAEFQVEDPPAPAAKENEASSPLDLKRLEEQLDDVDWDRELGLED